MFQYFKWYVNYYHHWTTNPPSNSKRDLTPVNERSSIFSGWTYLHSWGFPLVVLLYNYSKYRHGYIGGQVMKALKTEVKIDTVGTVVWHSTMVYESRYCMHPSLTHNCTYITWIVTNDCMTKPKVYTVFTCIPLLPDMHICMWY